MVARHSGARVAVEGVPAVPDGRMAVRCAYGAMVRAAFPRDGSFPGRVAVTVAGRHPARFTMTWIGMDEAPSVARCLGARAGRHCVGGSRGLTDRDSEEGKRSKL